MACHSVVGETAEGDAWRVVSGSADKTVRIWDGEDGKALHTLEVHRWVYGGGVEAGADRDALYGGERGGVYVHGEVARVVLVDAHEPHVVVLDDV